MALTPEAKVKKKVKDILDQMGAYHFSPMQNGMGRAGIPDIIVCFEGRFIGIECKAGKGTTTALQERELTRIQEAGGIALVVNETNINQLWEIKEWMTHIV
jgi:Holliday junction resolvase